MTRRVLSDAEKDQVQKIENKALEFWQFVGELGAPCRELDIAQVKIQEAIFWACKSVTR